MYDVLLVITLLLMMYFNCYIEKEWSFSSQTRETVKSQALDTDLSKTNFSVSGLSVSGDVIVVWSFGENKRGFNRSVSERTMRCVLTNFPPHSFYFTMSQLFIF